MVRVCIKGMYVGLVFDRVVSNLEEVYSSLVHLEQQPLVKIYYKRAGMYSFSAISLSQYSYRRIPCLSFVILFGPHTSQMFKRMALPVVPKSLNFIVVFRLRLSVRLLILNIALSLLALDIHESWASLWLPD